VEDKLVKTYTIENHYTDSHVSRSIRNIDTDNDILNNLDNFIEHCFRRVPSLKEVQIKFKRNT
jgi:hypothetical protein